MSLKPKQLAWLKKSSGPKSVGKAAKADQIIQDRKAEMLKRMTEQLDQVREEIRQGQKYVLEKKGLLPGKMESIVDGEHTIREVDTWEDMVKAKALPPDKVQLILEAQRKVLELQKEMAEATENGEPLFKDQELMDEVWDPLKRERIVPDNAIPGKFSRVQRAFEGSAKAMVDRMVEVSSQTNNERDEWLGIAKDSINVLGGVGVLAESLAPGNLTIAKQITMGVQTILAGGIDLARGYLQKDGDMMVDGISSMLGGLIGNINPAAGKMAAGGFRAAAKSIPIAMHLAKGEYGEAAASLGDALQSALMLCDAANKNGPYGEMSKTVMDSFVSGIAGALRSQEKTINLAVEAIKTGEKPSLQAVIQAVVIGAGRAVSTYVGVETELMLDPIKKEAETAQEEAKTAKEDVDKQNEEVGKLKEEADKLKEEAAKDPNLEDKAKEAEDKAKEAEDKAKEAEEKATSAENKLKEAEVIAKQVEMRVDAVKDKVEGEKELRERTEQAKETAEQKKARQEKLEAKLEKLRAPLDEKHVKKEEEKLRKKDAEELAVKSAEFQALLKDTLSVSADEVGEQGAEDEQKLHDIERLIKQVEADRMVLESFQMMAMAIDITGLVVPHAAAAAAAKDMVFSVLAAAERFAQLVIFKNMLKESRNAMSPYAQALKNNVDNLETQFSKHTFDAILELAQAVGAAVSCSGVDCMAGHAVAKGAQAVQKGGQIIFQIKEKVEMQRAWSLFREANKNPEARRAGKKALRDNPTLAKYALAYGGLVEGDPMARRALNQCGLTDEVLAHEETNTDKVVTYLEALFYEDPTLYKPMPNQPKWMPKKLELTLDCWTQVKMAALNPEKGKLASLEGAGAVDGGFARWFQAEAAANKKESPDSRVEKELTDGVAALTELADALGALDAKDKDNREHKEMKEYATIMAGRAGALRAEFETQLGKLQADEKDFNRLCGEIKPKVDTLDKSNDLQKAFLKISKEGNKGFCRKLLVELKDLSSQLSNGQGAPVGS